MQDAELLAPNNGIILTRVREPGAIIGGGRAGARPVAHRYGLRARVCRRAHLGRVVPGSSLVITTDSSDREYVGTVGFVSPRAEFTPNPVETPGCALTWSIASG